VDWHANGDDASALVEFQLAEIAVTVELERAMHSSSYRDFFSTSANWRRLFIVIILPVMMQLSGNGHVSYFLNEVLDSIGITSGSEQLTINGCLMIYNFVCAVFCACLVEYLGRRRMFLTCITGMLITYVVWTVLSAVNQERNFKQHSLAQGMLAMIFLYYFAYGMGLTGLPYLYLTEILPYNLRAKGIAISQFTGKLVLIYNGFVNPIAMEAIAWKYYIVIVAL
jgi:MFS family permease